MPFNRSEKSDNLSLLTESLVNDRFTVVVDRDLFGNRSTVSLEASTADLARPLTGWSRYFFYFLLSKHVLAGVKFAHSPRNAIVCCA